MGFRGVEPGFPHLLRPRKVKQNIPLMLQSDMTLKFCFTFCVFNKNNAHNHLTLAILLFRGIEQN